MADPSISPQDLHQLVKSFLSRYIIYLFSNKHPTDNVTIENIENQRGIGFNQLTETINCFLLSYGKI